MSTDSRTNYYLKSRHIRCASSRFSYIERIAKKLLWTEELLPEPNGEQLYNEALSHLVDVLSTKRYPVMGEGCHYDCKNERCNNGKKRSGKREEIMEKILSKLKCVERRRLYDPPSDAEIGYYRLIKKYVISMGVFFSSRKTREEHVSGRFHCVTPYSGLHYLEELEEGNAHLEQFSAYLTQISVKNIGYDIKQLLGISEMDEVPQVRKNMVCDGSKVRNNLFYYHKFRLALFDLVSSHHAFHPPCPEEKKCYEQVLDHIIVPPPQHTITTTTKEGEGEASVCSDDLLHVFFTRLLDNIRNLEKHCGHAANEILAKLSIRDSWEKLASHCTMYGVSEEEEAEGISCFAKEALQNCNVSSAEELEHHARDVDRFLQICNYVMEFIMCLQGFNSRVPWDIHSSYHCDYTSPYVSNAHWEVLHACTVFKNGCSFPAVNELGEKDMLQNILKPCGSKMKNQAGDVRPQDERKEEEENGNVEMLKEILEELRMIGDWLSEPLPTCKEDKILLMISRSVSSSSHFFLCAIAYQQRTSVIQHGGIHTVRRTSTKKRKRDDSKDDEFYLTFRSVLRRWDAFILVLEGYKNGLLQKLQKLEELIKHGCSFPAVNELGENDMLRTVLQPCGSKMKNQAALRPHDERKEAESGNVEMLKEILEELRMIGDLLSEPLPTSKEDTILLMICRSVSSSTHFFLCAMAYQQMTSVTQHGDIHTVKRTPTKKRKRDDISCNDFFLTFRSVVRRWDAFISVLEGYKDGLLQKLKKSEGLIKHGA